MREGGRYIAIDRGTTNRHAHLMGEAGEVLDTLRDDGGVLAVERGRHSRRTGVPLYAIATEQAGGRAVRIDGQVGFAARMHSICHRIQEMSR